MKKAIRVMLALCAVLVALPVAAVPMINMKIDLYGDGVHARQRIGAGIIRLAGFPAGLSDPSFFDGPGELKVFSFDSLPEFPGAPWHYGLDNLLFEWGAVSVDPDGIVSRWEFQTAFGYAYGHRQFGSANQFEGRWQLTYEYGGTLRGRTVPEPGTAILLLTGMLGYAVLQWRQRPMP